MSLAQLFALDILMLLMATFANMWFGLRSMYVAMLFLLGAGSVLGGAIGTFFSISTAILLLVAGIFVADAYLKKYHRTGFFD